MKKSSYQKLKEENAKLKKDIYLLVMQELSFDSIQTRLTYRMKFEMQDQIMYGTPTIMTEQAKEGVKRLVEMEPLPPPMRYFPEPIKYCNE